MNAELQQLRQLQPFIRVGHHYQFPYERNVYEAGRHGYGYAFHLVDGGKGKLTIDGSTYPLKKGDLVYVPPRMAHSFYTDHDHRLSTYNLYCELWNERPTVTEQHLYWSEADYLPGLMTVIREDSIVTALPYHLPLQHQGLLTEMFRRIVMLHQSNEPLASEAARSMLKAFLLEAVRLSADERRSDSRMAAIMDRIDREAHAGSDYYSWLAQSGLHKTQFHSLFKLSSGLSPKAYWTRAVMRQAAAALWESNRSITTISEDLGYSSIHQFTKRFTAYYGVSPTQYRKRKHEPPLPPDEI